MSWTFEETRAGYGKMWRSAMIKTGPDDAASDRFADKIIAAETRYRKVEAATGVPWFFIGALHMRESGCDFDGVLHNGEKIINTSRVTTLEPDGRGPFASWEEAAVDALKIKNLHRVQAWPVERMLHASEVFNGLGYVSRGVNSPYVWAGTNHEQPGKFVRDHVFDRSFDDPQLGVAAVLKRLGEKRPDIAAELASQASQELEPTMPDTAPPAASDDRLRQLLVLLVPLLLQLLGGKPLAVPPPAEPAPPPPPASAPAPVMEKPSVQLGTAGLMISTVLQALGMVGTPFGVGTQPTTAGTLATLIPLATTAIGATGGFGALLGIGARLLGALAGAAKKP